MYQPKHISEKQVDLILQNLDMLFARKFGLMKINVADGSLLRVDFEMKIPQEEINVANKK